MVIKRHLGVLVFNSEIAALIKIQMHDSHCNQTKGIRFVLSCVEQTFINIPQVTESFNVGKTKVDLKIALQIKTPIARIVIDSLHYQHEIPLVENSTIWNCGKNMCVAPYITSLGCHLKSRDIDIIVPIRIWIYINVWKSRCHLLCYKYQYFRQTFHDNSRWRAGVVDETQFVITFNILIKNKNKKPRHFWNW